VDDLRWFASNPYTALVVPHLRRLGLTIATNGDRPARLAVAMSGPSAAHAWRFARQRGARLLLYIWDLPPGGSGRGRPDPVWWIAGRLLRIPQAERFRGTAPRPLFTTTTPAPGQFDLVYCQEVIEHVEDDSALIGELVSYLAPGGSVVGTTPVGKYFWDPHHRRAYDEALLRRALAPWGRVRVDRCYRTPLRNLLPIRQHGAAVFIFEVASP
jgi:SAM-dependent methyltransferase